MLLVVAVATMILGIFSVFTLASYVGIYHVLGGDTRSASFYAGWGGTVYMLTSLAAAGPIAWISGRLGKRVTLIGCLALALGGNVSTWWLYTPENPWLQLIPSGFIALGFAALWTLTSSMTADVCDADEHATGLRREGTFGAVYGWVQKLGVSLAFALGGFVLSGTGFDQELTVQPEAVLTRMRIAMVAIPTVAYLIAIGCIFFYPLTEAQRRVGPARLGSAARFRRKTIGIILAPGGTFPHENQSSNCGT